MFHQFYFTHCTYASSALERKSGEVGPHPLGYSARSASVQGPALREIFRRLERFVYYYLPTDTPVQEKESSTDVNSPKRLVFLPETDFGPVLMQLAYRPKDTAGRIGSYFCHVLAGDEKALEKIVATSGKSGSGPVPPTPPVPPSAKVPPSTKIPPTAGGSVLTAHSALQLWNAAEWVSKDEDWFPHDIQPFDSLQDVLKGNSPAIDDRVLASFLTTEPGGTFYDPKKVIPERWRKMLVTERQQIFKTILYGFLLMHDQPAENLLLVVEPGMAALLFYGISEFFPQSLFRTQSFSTYEPLPDRLLTKLAATTFHSPETNDLNDALYHSRSFVLNTWNGRTSNFDAENLPTSYVAHVWKQFLAGGLAQVKTFCATFNSVGLASMNDLKALIEVENVYHQIMLDDESSISNRKQVPAKLADLSLSSSRTAVTLLKRRIADGLTKIMAQPLPEAEKALKNVIGTPGQLLLLELLGTGGNLPNVQSAVKFLTDSLPMEFLSHWLKSSLASDEYKGKLLEKWFIQLRTMPKGCEFLWKISVESLKTGSVPGRKPPVPNANVLPETLLRLPHDVLWDAFQSAAVVPFQKEMVLAYTLGVSRLVERDGALSESVMAVRKRLDLFIQKVPESLFGAIYREFGNWFFLNYPGDSLFLGEKFTKLEETIFLKPEEITAKLEILFDIQDILPDRVLPRVKRWRALQKAVQAVTNFQAQPGKKFQFRVLDQACEALAQAAYEVFEDVRFLAACGGPEASEFAKIGKINNAQRNRMVEQELMILPELFRQWFHADFLPAGNKSHELLQKKLKFYLQTKEWKAGGGSAFGNKILIFAVLGGIAIGLALVLLFYFIFCGSGNPQGPTLDDARPSQIMTTEKEGENAEVTDSSNAENGRRGKNVAGKKNRKSSKVTRKSGTDSAEGEESKTKVEPEETTYNPETDDETAQLADAEGEDDGENSGEKSELETDGEELSDEEAVLEEPLLPGKRFQPTDPAFVQGWNRELAEDGFARFVTLEMKPTINFEKESLNPKVFTSLESSENWFRSENSREQSSVSNLRLERGYIFFEGTAYPFGESNCVAEPTEVVAASPEEAAVGAEGTENGKAPEANLKPLVKTSGKNVLTAEKVARTPSDDEPGLRYSVPALAEALGLEKVYVEFEGGHLTIHIQKEPMPETEYEALSEELEALENQLNELTVALNSTTATNLSAKQQAFNHLADLVGKKTFKNQLEKQDEILAVAVEKQKKLEWACELKKRVIPSGENHWTLNEVDVVRRFQSREMKIFTPIDENPVPLTVSAVFSGNFFYNLPLPAGIQTFIEQNRKVKKLRGNSEAPQNSSLFRTDVEEADELATVESTEDLKENSGFENDWGNGFQQPVNPIKETGRLYVLRATEDVDELEGRDFLLKEDSGRKKKKKEIVSLNSIEFKLEGFRIPHNLLLTARIREVIPGENETQNHEIGEISEETGPIELGKDSRFVLISFQIQDREALNAGRDAKIYITPYYQIKLGDGEDLMFQKHTLVLQFSKSFLGKFTAATLGSGDAPQSERLSKPSGKPKRSVR